MKLEIDLDLNQIDYEAINKQIQEKIDAMNLKEVYQISSKIDSQIREKAASLVDYELRGGSWSGLNDTSKREIRDEITKCIRELVKPHVENMFSQIPEEELHQIISDLLPKILIEMITSDMQGMMTNYYCTTKESIINDCQSRIFGILGR